MGQDSGLAFSFVIPDYWGLESVDPFCASDIWAQVMSVIDKEKEHVIPFSSKVHLPMVHSHGSVLPSSKTLNTFHHSSIQIESRHVQQRGFY